MPYSHASAPFDIPLYCNNPIFYFLHISTTYCSRDEKRMQKVTSCARLHLGEYPTVLHLKCYKRQMKYFIRIGESTLVVGGINISMQNSFA